NGFLMCLDSIVIHWMGSKRYIITAIDKYSKIAFARMYSSHSSESSADFLRRLHYLLQGKIENVQTDNGSEFLGRFEEECVKLKLGHYFSRVCTPKDNAVCERFNRTLQDEFIKMGYMSNDVTLFNRNLTEWLVEYNFHRPHQTLNYEPPINFHYLNHNLLPMYPSSTDY
ncbi:MAG: integrase core domain-containing protein, partial [Patescibacteria group bacterium]|nr:integrase core domain-containing protein [Patescibacteria group bacterium]